MLLKANVDAANEQLKQLIDLVWMFVVLVMIFNMQMGFTLIEVGNSRHKHSHGVLVKNILDTLICTLGFWFVGYDLSTNA